jgi:ABC-type lipoprotein release transport system permease subunit
MWGLIGKRVIRGKGDSLVVLLLIGTVTALCFVGESLVLEEEGAMRRAYRESLTGELVLEKETGVTMNLFGANQPGMGEFFTLPPLPSYERAKEIALGEEGVRDLTSQVSSRALLELEGFREQVPLCGIEEGSYFRVFPGIVLEEGSFLTGEGEGILITGERAERIAIQRGRRPEVGEKALLTSAGEAGFKIREAPIVGIFSYPYSGGGMGEIVLADPRTVRVLESVQGASPPVSSGGETVFLLERDVEDLFGGEAEEGEEESGEGFSLALLEEALRKGESGEREEERGGEWHFILLRLEEGASSNRVMASLNGKLSPYGIRVVDWRTAAGGSAMALLLLQGLFGGGMGLVSAAGVIATVNVLSISVWKRTVELGTLRAMGMGVGGIRFLVWAENLLLSGIAGVGGLLFGFGAIVLINSLTLDIPNAMVSSLLGGGTLDVTPSPLASLLSFSLALALGAASLVPCEKAARVSPASAVRIGS